MMWHDTAGRTRMPSPCWGRVMACSQGVGDSTIVPRRLCHSCVRWGARARKYMVQTASREPCTACHRCPRCACFCLQELRLHVAVTCVITHLARAPPRNLHVAKCQTQLILPLPQGHVASGGVRRQLVHQNIIRNWGCGQIEPKKRYKHRRIQSSLLASRMVG